MFGVSSITSLLLQASLLYIHSLKCGYKFCLCFPRFCASPSSQLHYVDNVLTFERPGIGIILVYMAAEGILFFILTMLIEVHRMVAR